MPTIHRLITLILTTTLCTTSVAAPVSVTIRAEVEALLSRLQSSGCQFNRNGSWYSGEEAKTHLMRKLKYFEGRNNIQSTEQFIQFAATSSSVSGALYLVKCGNAPELPSQQWLTTELAEIRSAVTNDRP